MEPELTIVHVRPRTEMERLRDVAYDAEDSRLGSIPSDTISLDSAPTPLTTSYMWGNENNDATSMLEPLCVKPLYEDIESPKKRENSRRERLKKTAGRIRSAMNLHVESEDGPAGLKQNDLLSPVSQCSGSGSDDDFSAGQIQDAVNKILFPDEYPSPENTKKSMHIIKKSVTMISKGTESHTDLLLGLVFHAMKNNPRTEHIQDRGCLILTRISRDSKHAQKAIVAKGGVPLIIRAMTTHTRSSNVQSRAIAALLCLTADKAARTQVIDYRGAELITWAMREFSGVMLLLKNGATCLCNLSFGCAESKRRIGRIGGIHVVVNAMNKFPQDVDLQARCCLALRNLACGLRANQWIAGRSQSMEAILRSMERMHADINIQYQGCIALANICGDEWENRMRAAELGLVPVALKILRKNLQNGPMCEHALTLLRNISIQNEHNQVSIGEHDGLELVLSCMKVHRFNKKVVGKGCGTLRYLLFAKANRERFLESNGIDSLVRIMRDGAEQVSVSEAVMYAIGNATCDNIDSKRAVGRNGGITAIVQIMANHLDSAAIQEHGCRALRNVADADELNLRLLTECGAIDTVLVAMMGYSDNGSIQEQGCAMLYNMTALEEGWRQARELEAVAVVTRSRCMHMDKSMVRLQADALLKRLKTNPNACAARPKKKASMIDSGQKLGMRIVSSKKSGCDSRGQQIARQEDTPPTRKLLQLLGSSGN